jgi:transcriptional regulator NrdR family protein
MVCVYCGAPTKVTNSRQQQRNNHIWRRRKCLACDNIFTTTERPELSTGLVVRDAEGKLRSFNRDRLFISVYQSCKHREVGADEATALTEVIINELVGHAKDGVLEATDIAQAAHTILKRFDKTMATFYAAYHPIIF